MQDQWAGLAQPFVDGAYATVKGRVRTYVIHQQLTRHLPPPPAAVLDVGGGAGHQSLPLARAGYSVTLLDPSTAMLERASEFLAREPDEVQQRVALLQGNGEDAPALVDGRRFDVVLCHGVVMYLEDPTALVGALTACAASNGLVSIVALNAHAMAVRPALEGRWSDALQSFDARDQTGVLGVKTRTDTVEQLSVILQQSGATPEAWYGVWMFSDWMELAGKPIADEHLREVAAVELVAGDRDPYRQLSRLFHLVGRRS